MEASVEEGLRKGRDALREAAGQRFLAREQPAEAVKLLCSAYMAAKLVEGTAEGVAPVQDPTIAGPLTQAGSAITGGRAKEAVDLAKSALASARNASDKALQLPVLRVLIAAHAAARDIDSALQASREMAKVAKKVGTAKAHVFARISLAEALLASGEPGQAIAAAEEAVALAGEGQDAELTTAALSAVYGVHRVVGKCASAQRAAEKVLEAVQGKKKAEASALLMVGDANPSSKASLSAASKAAAAFRELGDEVGEGAALVALAFAYGSQAERQYEDGVRAALSAVSIFRERGEKTAEAVALCTASRANSLREDKQDAARFANEALQIFREQGFKVGEAYAAELLADAPYASLQQAGARLMIDEASLAHIEVNETATQDSLENIVAALHQFNHRGKMEHFKAVVLHVEGSPAPSRLHSFAIATGTFLVGIRSVGVPVVSCCWGTIAGPSWGLAFGGDYRIAAADTTFVTPILRPMECLAALVGQQNYAQLTIEHGTLTAGAMLEMGMMHQVQPDAKSAQKSAQTQAKRITNFPVLASRQTLSLMCPDAQTYVNVQ